MRILVTGARGKVGSRVVRAARAAGHTMTATDIAAAVYGSFEPGQARYVRADLTDYGQIPNHWSYVDADDLADLVVRAAAADTSGHEVVYAAQPDNLLGRPLADLLEEAYGTAAPPLRELSRPDAGGIAIGKARKLFGWDPQRSWRDHVGRG